MSLPVSGAACHLRLKKEKKKKIFCSSSPWPPSVLHLMTPGLHQKILTDWTATLSLHHRVLLFFFRVFGGGEGVLGSRTIKPCHSISLFKPSRLIRTSYSVSIFHMKLLTFIAVGAPICGIMCYEIHKRISYRFRCSPKSNRVIPLSFYWMTLPPHFLQIYLGFSSVPRSCPGVDIAHCGIGKSEKSHLGITGVMDILRSACGSSG